MFRQVDPRVFAALRLVFGALALLSLAGQYPDAAFYYSDEGWLPVKLAADLMRKGEWSLLLAFRSPAAVKLFLLLGMAAALAMTAGFRSRTSTWLTFLAIVSLNSRNWMTTHGGDAVLRLMLFHIALSRSGAAWSVDALIARHRRGVRLMAEQKTPLAAAFAATRPSAVPAWPLLLIQIQVCLLYFTSGWAKLHGADWANNGNAMAVVLLNPLFARFDYSFISDNERWLAPLRWLTRSVLAWELLFPLLVLNRWTRRLALGFGVLVHAGTIVLLDLRWFGYLMIGTYLAFLPATAFRRAEVMAKRALRRWRAREKLRVSYDPECSACRSWVGLAGMLDVRRALVPTVQDGDDRDILVIRTGDRLASGRAALGVLIRACPLLSPLAVLRWRPLWRAATDMHDHGPSSIPSQIPTPSPDTAPAPRKAAANDQR